MKAHQIEKLVAELSSTADSLTKATRHFIVRDHVTGLRFLVDTGADVLVIPISMRGHLQPSDHTLYAANGTIIPTYGQKLMQLDLGFRRVFLLAFCDSQGRFIHY